MTTGLAKVGRHIPSDLPLDGVLVVELCHSIAGPFSTSILAQLGAKVIKVEKPVYGDDARAWGPPDWEGASAIFQAMNRDKYGVVLDLKASADRERLLSLIQSEADVVVQSLRPGVVESLGLGADELRRAKPSLVYCNLGAFGASGPAAGRPGYDPLMQARGGLMSVTGEAGREPVRVGVSIIDMGAGMWAAIGILAALYGRTRSGRGAVVGTSLFETSLAWMNVHLAGYLASGELRTPMGSGVAEIVPHQAFQTADGFLMVAAGNDNLFEKLTATLDAPWLSRADEYRTNSLRVRNREQLILLLSAIFNQRNTEHWLQVLDVAGVPCAPLQSVKGVLADPQTNAVGMVQAVPGTGMSLVGLPLQFDGERPSCRMRAPRLGEHNAAVFSSSTPLASGVAYD